MRFAVSRVMNLLPCALLAASAIGLSMAPSLATAGEAKPATPAKASADAALVKVDDAWVRPTVKGQTASGGYMSLTASQNLTLVGFATMVAGETELHDMVMDGSVMRMRAIESLALPAGQTVTLKSGPGGKHLMLMDLKQQLNEGDVLILTLKLRNEQGKTLTQDIRVPVKASPMMQGGGMQHHHGH